MENAQQWLEKTRSFYNEVPNAFKRDRHKDVFYLHKDELSSAFSWSIQFMGRLAGEPDTVQHAFDLTVYRHKQIELEKRFAGLVLDFRIDELSILMIILSNITGVEEVRRASRYSLIVVLAKCFEPEMVIELVLQAIDRYVGKTDTFESN